MVKNRPQCRRCGLNIDPKRSLESLSPHLSLRSHGQRNLGSYSSWGSKRSQIQLSDSATITLSIRLCHHRNDHSQSLSLGQTVKLSPILIKILPDDAHQVVNRWWTLIFWHIMMVRLCQTLKIHNTVNFNDNFSIPIMDPYWTTNGNNHLAVREMPNRGNCVCLCVGGE